jgi:exosome complex RNA-binding protein Rrp42 (RNase PH superfamily)
MLDCACLAGIVALRHFRKPEVEVEGEEVIVVCNIQHVIFHTDNDFSS